MIAAAVLLVYMVRSATLWDHSEQPEDELWDLLTCHRSDLWQIVRCHMCIFDFQIATGKSVPKSGKESNGNKTVKEPVISTISTTA